MRLKVVAGVGFEPHDLRVMSPTSDRTAPPRDKLTTMIVYHYCYIMSILFNKINKFH